MSQTISVVSNRLSETSSTTEMWITETLRLICKQNYNLEYLWEFIRIHSLTQTAFIQQRIMAYLDSYLTSCTHFLKKCIDANDYWNVLFFLCMRSFWLWTKRLLCTLICVIPTHGPSICRNLIVDCREPAVSSKLCLCLCLVVFLWVNSIHHPGQTVNLICSSGAGLSFGLSTAC